MTVGRSPVLNAEADSPVAYRTQCPFNPLALFPIFHFPRAFMNAREHNALDRYNTGNYGEDQPPILDTDQELFEYPDEPDRSIDYDAMPATAVLPPGAMRDALVNQIREMMSLYGSAGGPGCPGVAEPLQTTPAGPQTFVTGGETCLLSCAVLSICLQSVRTLVRLQRRINSSRRTRRRAHRANRGPGDE